MAMEDAAAREARRSQYAEDLIRQTGLDEETIARVVDLFYERARRDALLGPIFNERVEDWNHHLAKIRDFWSSVALMSGRYHGHPMRAHLPLPVGEEHFRRWLALFGETAGEICRPEGAAFLIDRAQRIAQSLQLGISVHRGEYPGEAP
jgi:hemoglobin